MPNPKTESEPKTKKEPRFHVVEGRIAREVVRTFYDPNQDCVIDVIKVPKIVVNRKGEEKEVFLTRKVYCRDEALQAKHRRGDAPVDIEIEEVD